MTPAIRRSHGEEGAGRRGLRRGWSERGAREGRERIPTLADLPQEGEDLSDVVAARAMNTSRGAARRASARAAGRGGSRPPNGHLVKGPGARAAASG